ncbi:fructose-1,6-bisphosphatase/inositol monophosphatase family enzyme [Zymomonas mobilis]|uniref:inositol monophosphatase family protein n=1 Tax=Zymomonas mobilis TaxID=542 RepID=UPI00026D8117|nr:inositol monophosphatase family protein [Zymomonas mobilis]AFN57528.1 inositol monophosphatase [Zymomonas mobilis subsp. mobilis ATCC 29191]TQK78705.1 fructose-1,6-bisphosphatase/inositol monophosphatase family enzyme [Zymomonas mobilis]TQL16091.1 fructose-1,6-bisphosphatase/inositol monophosphatase family enzyme [Zymomonas mobilis]GEB86901.1 inositol monophosphatase [Zymomonas mobilis subsp. mobilis]
MHPLYKAVATLMYEVANDLLVPRFRHLSENEIAEKEPGDYVTVVDKESEKRITEQLAKFLPEAYIVGEEATAADTSLLKNLKKGLAWTVDPLDGTGNYAAGQTPYAMMIALLGDGEPQAGWILDPVSGRMCHASKGQGAFVDGERVTTRSTGQDIPVVALSARVTSDNLRPDFDKHHPLSHGITLAPSPLCAGEQYPRIVLGENDAAVFWRSWPWDHAPGSLFLEEAGGKLARFDGSAYDTSDCSHGMLGANSPATWDRVAESLLR